MPVVPGTPGADLPPGSDALIRRIQELERAVRELAAANPLATAGLVPALNALTVQGNLNVTGTETISGNLSVTGTETVSGALNVTGPMTVGGTLSLPAGIINNDALANPISPLTTHADAANFSLATGANVEKVRSTISVPTGFTRALVIATAMMSAQNTSATADEMYLACVINGFTPGWSSEMTVQPAKIGTCTNVSTTLLTGLGSSFYITAKASTYANAWAAPGTGNFALANLDSLVIFLH